jgi:hypothetical protein
MRGLQFINATLVNCVFMDCELTDFDFGATSLADCRFVGRLKTGWFRKGYMHPALAQDFGSPQDNQMLRVDFSDAVLTDVVFAGGVPLDSVVLPTDGAHRFYTHFPQRLVRLWKETEKCAVQDRAEAWRLIWMYLDTSADQQDVVLNVHDLQGIQSDTVPTLLGSLDAPILDSELLSIDSLKASPEWHELVTRKQREWKAVTATSGKPKPRIRSGRGPYSAKDRSQ